VVARLFNRLEVFVMDRYMPVTGIDCSIAVLLIDT
jgi:hypothetical protein